MRRFLPKTLNQWLLAAIPLVLLLAWLLNHWLLGVAAVLSALCVLAVRNPKFEGNWRRLPWLQKLFPQPAAPAPIQPAPVMPAPPPPPRRIRRHEAGASLAEQMIDQGRVALLLRPQVATSLSAADLEQAQAALDEAMAIVPQGQVAMRSRAFDHADDENPVRAERLIQVEGFFLDRFCVTNHDYEQFVADGGYEQMSLWDESIWPAVLGFVDRSGQPGPRYWENSTYAANLADHPVVGVSWYEACAYARWAGKRLPTDPEWVKAGSWPVFAEGAKPVQRRFPWGDSMDRKRVNVWGSGYVSTVAVHAMPAGASVNGVQQLIGNVWEWTSSTFGAWEPASRKIETALPLKSVRGGAYDTYFDTQSHCQFQSGESPLARKHNIGFRCSLGFCDVIHQIDQAAEDDADTRNTDRLPTATPEEVHA
ncbi:MAG TPA: SUMF1/EgtB/PvdO family nonheme iron enzyme [Pirellulaceae bacterium]|nr:SUMF1/EgtB/PvdO family nonheme iron enzyme [Pirellulaceae bacterium]